MADNPFVVKGDEWGYCVEFKTRCMKAWSDGTCISTDTREKCEHYAEAQRKGDKHESNI